ncbi:hypothetical protein O181_077602 [Austropuccinia psidii MF-1]|uniref:Formin GTPase-binding domain-containing protein n=1 Tax=Austropuccinia psidii MF-1 TaxID=1389203 RepID=A0A9Q3FIZ3_9BASI|nr:hypothetical protein [Austropuccinia psidii MF-1]
MLPQFLSSSTSNSDPASNDSSSKLNLSAIASKILTGVTQTTPEIARNRWSHTPNQPGQSNHHHHHQRIDKSNLNVEASSRCVTASAFAAAKQERAAIRQQLPAGHNQNQHPNFHPKLPSNRPLSTLLSQSPHSASPAQTHFGLDNLNQVNNHSPIRSKKSSAPPSILNSFNQQDPQLSQLMADSSYPQSKENEPPLDLVKKNLINLSRFIKPTNSDSLLALTSNNNQSNKIKSNHQAIDHHQSRAINRPSELLLDNSQAISQPSTEQKPLPARIENDNSIREIYLAQAVDHNGRIENEKQRVDREFEKLLDSMQITDAIRTKMNALDHPVKSAMLKSSTLPNLAKMLGHEIQVEPIDESKVEGSAWWAMYLKSHNFRELLSTDLKRLRVALRTQPPAWTRDFVGFGGYLALLKRLKELLEIEWREEQHDDQVLYEILRCFKALLLTEPGRDALGSRTPDPFIQLTGLLYSEKKPGDLSSRQTLLEILQGCFAIDGTRPKKLDWNALISLDGPRRNLENEETDSAHMFVRKLLMGPPDQKKEQLVEFVAVTHRSRPFKTFVGEFVGVLMDYFWVFCHSENQFWDLKLIDEEKLEAPKVPSGMTGGVEYEAMSYCTAMMKLLNQLIKTSDDDEEAIRIHAELFESGFERCLITLRKSSTAYYPMVHLEIARYLELGIKNRFEFPFSIKRHFLNYPPLN